MSGWRRGILWLGAAAYFAGALAWLARSRPPEKPVFDDGSVFNTSPRGLSLAYRYLAERRPPGAVAVLSRIVAGDELPGSGVVLRVRPRILPFLLRTVRLGAKGDTGFDDEADDDASRTKKEKEEAGRKGEDGKKDDAKKDKKKTDKGKSRKTPPPLARLLTPRERAWIEAGGRLVLALADRYGTAEIRLEGKGDVQKVFPLWPGVTRLAPDPARTLAGLALAEAHAVLVLGDRPVASRWLLGRGELVLLACPEVLENRLLGQADHLALLEALAEPGRPIYFDEYVHGALGETGTLELMTRWGLGPTLVLLSAIGVVVLWRGRSRVGPEEDDHRETRSDAVDLLDSLAQLYDRAVRRDEALALYYESLSRAVSWKTGLRDEALRRRLRDMAGPPPPRGGRRQVDLPPDDFARRLRAINEGYRRLRHVESR